MWSITEVCARTGLSPRTVRYYEEIGLLPGVRRSEGGRRIYGADEIERLGFISRLKAMGLSLAEIGELNAVYGIGGSTQAMLTRLNDLLAIHLADVDRRIAELSDLRQELVAYRDHVEERVEENRGLAREAGSVQTTPMSVAAGPDASGKDRDARSSSPNEAVSLDAASRNMS
jgi:DNA-binding transcriptional MerR regulator